MSRLLQHWRAASADLGLRLKEAFVVDLGPNGILEADLLVEDFGAPKGMLVFSDFRAVTTASGRILDQLGYGYSVMGEPRPEEDYSRDEFVSVLSDWGWSGDPTKRPRWLVDD